MRIPTQKVTIYNKYKDNQGTHWKRTVLNASWRNTNVMKLTTQGMQQVDGAIIRFFDLADFQADVEFAANPSGWTAQNDDIIVDQESDQEITAAPMTELRSTYGQAHVVKVFDTTVSIYGTRLDHVKVKAE